MADPNSRPYVALPGSDRQLVPGAQAIGPSDPSEVIQVTIRLRSRASTDQLEAQVAALGSQAPADRTYLTPEQYESLFGADPADIAKVEQFARDNHLTVVRADPAQRTVIVSGPIRDITAAFRVELIQYSSPRGNYRGRVGPVQIPADLQGIIEGVFGL